MKFIHISDLHLGKRLHETSLIEDQQTILFNSGSSKLSYAKELYILLKP